MLRSTKLALAGLSLAVAIGALAWSLSPRAVAEDKPAMALITSLPIYWNESAEMGGLLDGSGEVHWVRQQLETDYRLLPLDVLAGEGEAEPSSELAATQKLLIAQPYPLPPADLAALDQWVRDGGKVLLFADPMLTEHSEFALGDRRRPQSIAMLSPLLARWGLELRYETSEADASSVDWNGVGLPLAKPGRFTPLASDFAACDLAAGGVIAECRVGKGRALLVADAAMLDAEQGNAARQQALEALLASAFRE